MPRDARRERIDALDRLALELDGAIELLEGPLVPLAVADRPLVAAHEDVTSAGALLRLASTLHEVRRVGELQHCVEVFPV